MRKYGSKKSRILSTGDSEKSKKTNTKSGLIRAKIDEFIQLLQDNKYKIITAITTMLLLALFIKTCYQSCKNEDSTMTKKEKSTEKIESVEKKEIDKPHTTKKIEVIKKTKKTTYKKPETYSEPLDKNAVKKKKPQKPNFGIEVDLITE